MTPRGRPRDNTLDAAALAATLTLLQENGYEQFGVRDVAKAASVGPGAVYRRWPSKKDLVAAALRLEGHDRASPQIDDPSRSS